MNSKLKPDSDRLRTFASRAALLLILLLTAWVSGCRLGQPASASFASVTIQNHTSEEIAAATQQVFAEDGYAGGMTQSGMMIFQKEGSRMNNLAYEGLVATQYGAQTAVRVKVETVSLGGNAYRLQCQAYMVRGAGDAFFEEEQRLSNVRRLPYQSMLDKIAKKLK